jgi:hypothetical protein
MKNSKIVLYLKSIINNISTGMFGIIMNMQRSLLKISVIVLVLLNNSISFGMIVKSQIEEQGKRNIARLYKNQDPEFVSKFLLSHYVPVMLIETTPACTGKDFEYYSVDPYKKAFYSDPDKQFVGKEREIAELGAQRLIEEQLILEQKVYDQQKKPNQFYHKGCLNVPLIIATLFGDDNDVLEKLNDIKDQAKKHDDNTNIAVAGALVHDAIIASMSYSHIQNNGLELLVDELKALRQKIEKRSNKSFIEKSIVEIESFWNIRNNPEFIGPRSSYLLLSLAAKNRDAFELLSYKDPYKTNMVLWIDDESRAKRLYGQIDSVPYSRVICVDNPGDKSRTNLDRMLEDKNFDQDNIGVFFDNGGMTTHEIGGMIVVDDILKNLWWPRPEILSHHTV